MPIPTSPLTYLGLLRLPGAGVAFWAATLARLAYATMGFALLLLVQRQTGSFTVAGTALGLFSLTSITAPLKARLLDRAGVGVVLSLLGLGLSCCLLGLALLGIAAVSSATPYLLLAALAGLLAPPVGPVMRALWARLTPQPADRQRAYSLDAVSEEALFVVGPLLAGAIALATSPATALLACAVLMSLGSTALARTTTGSTHPGSTHHETVTGGGELLGPLRLTGVRWLLLVMVAVGFALAAVEIGVVARATANGRPASAAGFLAALSIASVLGGLLWGRSQRTAGPAVLLRLLAVMALGVTLAALLPGRPLLLASLLLIGLVLAPTFVVAYVLADELVDDRVRTETNTWLGTVHTSGTPPAHPSQGPSWNARPPAKRFFPEPSSSVAPWPRWPPGAPQPCQNRWCKPSVADRLRERSAGPFYGDPSLLLRL